MNKEFSFNFKSLYKSKFKIAVILNIIAVICIILLCHNKFKVKEEEKVFIMMSDNLVLSEQMNQDLFSISQKYDMEEFLALGYDEKDPYFGQVISTKGYYGTDLFIFNFDVVNQFKDMEIFKVLDGEYISLTEEYKYDSKENIIGLQINDKYCVLVNKKSEKSIELLFELVEYIVLNGGEIGE